VRAYQHSLALRPDDGRTRNNLAVLQVAPFLRN
jgi:hypothetical protein